MDGQIWTLIGIISGGLLGLAGVIYTAQTARRANTAQAAQAFAGNLLGRVQTLENQMAELQGKIRALDNVVRAFSNFVDRLGTWLEYGQTNGKPRPLPPTTIHEYIDTSMWERSQGGDGKESEERS